MGGRALPLPPPRNSNTVLKLLKLPHYKIVLLNFKTLFYFNVMLNIYVFL